jgi:hypothetical protein
MCFTTLTGTARTDLSAADGRAPGRRQERGRSLAGTYNLGGWFTAAGGRRPSEGPVPDVRPEGSGQRPRRPGGQAIRAATAAWLGVTNPLQGGEPWPGCAAAAPGSGPCTRCTTTPGGRLAVRVFAALAEFIRGTHRGGVRAVRRRDRAARPGSGAAGLAVPRTGRPGPRRSRRPARGAAEGRDLTHLRIPGFPAGTAAGPGTA